ncbi:hypothetical protein JL100_008450 [Skermanella mucosa]|uniref:hypothetical protein n=1 Tax=Skermanella mucosa TaxID=1789672 RepID=UPI00192BE7EC|nr:hypothetical protein [Skermanella mucosa]UEM22761.1 hypothetical protein JL100_008450 [Skermanella mucosa]
MRQDDDPNGAAKARSRLLDTALGIVEVLRDHRITVTEAEPTDAMVAAGMAVSGLGAEQVRAIFRAMLAANAHPPGRTQ